MCCEIYESGLKTIGQCRTDGTIAFVVAPEKNDLKIGHINRVLKVWSGVMEEFVDQREMYGDYVEFPLIDDFACRPGESGHFQVKQPAFAFADLARDFRKSVGEQLLKTPLIRRPVLENEIAHQPYRN